MLAHAARNGICENLQIGLGTDGLVRCIFQIRDIGKNALSYVTTIVQRKCLSVSKDRQNRTALCHDPMLDTDQIRDT